MDRVCLVYVWSPWFAGEEQDSHQRKNNCSGRGDNGCPGSVREIPDCPYHSFNTFETFSFSVSGVVKLKYLILTIQGISHIRELVGV